MKVVYAITSQLRIELKEPFGILIEGTFQETMAKLKELVAKEKPSMIISVGDVVSKNLHSYHLHPQVTVIDNVSLRNQPTPPPQAHGEQIVNVVNPQGTITEEAISAIQQAIAQSQHTHIVVDGEEDLLVLVAVLYAPIKAFVVYGQPHCGIVVVKVSSEKKARAKGFLNEMKPTKS
jgi:uncharacterized protein (UPF0218 family)